MRYLITMTVDIEEVTMRKPGRPRKAVPDSDVTNSSPHAPTVQQVAYGIREAADVLGISRSSVYKLIKEKQLSVVKLGKRALIPVREIQALIDGLQGK
jgi:excisionase family DNA binding protein